MNCWHTFKNDCEHVQYDQCYHEVVEYLRCRTRAARFYGNVDPTSPTAGHTLCFQVFDGCKDCIERGFDFRAIRTAPLRHVRSSATALAADRLYALLEQFHRIPEPRRRLKLLAGDYYVFAKLNEKIKFQYAYFPDATQGAEETRVNTNVTQHQPFSIGFYSPPPAWKGQYSRGRRPSFSGCNHGSSLDNLLRR